MVRWFPVVAMAVAGACAIDLGQGVLPCDESLPCLDGQVCYRGVCIAEENRDAGAPTECAPEGLEEPCFSREENEALAGIGPCVAGTRRCVNGVWSGCLGEVGPEAETCNSVDDDCDALVDEQGLASCETGRPGRCAAGIRRCSESGGGALCEGTTAAESESCNGEDDDCDGRVDEGTDQPCYPAGVRGCEPGPDGALQCVGACVPGVRRCVEGERMACEGEVRPVAGPDGCSATMGAATDDDCDGETDEDCDCVPGTTQACYSGPAPTLGVGACRGGTQRCEDSGGIARFGACSGERTPAAETCSNPGRDDDCDGVQDDVPGEGQVCNVGGAEGVCRSGVSLCSGGTIACTGPAPVSERCDGLDDDCDGAVDELYDLAQDLANCGSCGNECEAGDACCTGACVDLESSAQHCGTCGNNCGSGRACCGGACVDLSGDPASCGACGVACETGESCCGGRCVDTSISTTSCGACGVSCGGSELCCAGTCAPPTAPACTGCPVDCAALGETCCSGSCVDLQNDELACGACGRSCDPGEICCGGGCVPSDPANCGACGNACGGGELCCSGACVPQDGSNCGGCGVQCAGGSERCCSGDCRDVRTDPTNCGTCGNACSGADVCSDRVCCGAGEASCGTVDTCFDLQTDADNCGGCGNVCPENRRRCLGGRCCNGGGNNCIG